ncbi:hypothetical protein SESBI_14681 [Sesbania bispinosa]|nr:hypothetical protein SESBI_14681 [Sesbania bispinosa]
MSMPPTTTAMRRRMEEPRARNCSASWKASSRVGVTTRANTPTGAQRGDAGWGGQMPPFCRCQSRRCRVHGGPPGPSGCTSTARAAAPAF